MKLTALQESALIYCLGLEGNHQSLYPSKSEASTCRALARRGLMEFYLRGNYGLTDAGRALAKQLKDAR